MRHYACAILVRDGRLLLGKRSSHRRAYANRWDVLGGRVEDGETVGQALVRELGEEVAVVPTAWGFLCTVSDTGPDARGEAAYHMHVVHAWTGEGPLMANDEHSGLDWFTVDEACALDGLALDEYRDVFRRMAVSAAVPGSVIP